jgi:BMFP domain-containing protein YqiC
MGMIKKKELDEKLRRIWSRLDELEQRMDTTMEKSIFQSEYKPSGIRQTTLRSAVVAIVNYLKLDIVKKEESTIPATVIAVKRKEKSNGK